MWKRLSRLPFLCFIPLALPLQALAQAQQSGSSPPDYYGPGPWQMMWAGGYWGWSFWWLCPLMMLFMILMFCAGFFFLRRLSGDGSRHWGSSPRPPADPRYSALDILDERFARGEIEQEEYAAKRSAILSGRL